MAFLLRAAGRARGCAREVIDVVRPMCVQERSVTYMPKPGEGAVRQVHDL